MGRMRDDTRAILRAGAGIFTFGFLSALLVPLTGGIRPHGPHSGLGWVGLIFCMAALPIAAFLLILGLAKWYEDRRRSSF